MPCLSIVLKTLYGRNRAQRSGKTQLKRHERRNSQLYGLSGNLKIPPGGDLRVGATLMIAALANWLRKDE